MPAVPELSLRCAVHPARPAVGTCPVCGRGRCGVDEATYAGRGCGFCTTAPAGPRPAGRLEVLIRAGLAGLAIALLDGWVETQYVRVHLMSLVAPFVGGLAAAWACGAAAGARDRRTRLEVLGIAAAAGLVGAALAFPLNSGGGLSPLHPLGRVGPPYVMAVLGVLAWPVVFGPTGRRRQPDGVGDGEGEEDAGAGISS